MSKSKMKEASKLSIDTTSYFTDHRSGQANKLHFTKRRILKNALILSSGFILLFTANDALTMLQSTMNREQGIGVDTQAIIYASFCISALLLPKYVIKKIGCKTTLVLSMASYVPILAANFYPRWALMVPCAILCGCGASLLWGSQCTYLNEISVIYAGHILSNKKMSRNQNEDCSSKNCNVIPKQSIFSDILKSLPSEHNENILFDDVDHKKESHVSGTVSSTLALGDAQFHQNSTTLSSSADEPSHSQRKLSEKIDFYQLDPNALNCLQRSKNVVPNPEAKVIESTTARFFGCHGMAYLSTHIWSNLMSYYVLQNDHTNDNPTNNDLIGNLSCYCGADFCNEESLCFIQHLEEPSYEVRYILTSACVALSMCSVMLVAVFMDSLKTDKKPVKFSLDLLMATFDLARKKKKVILLIPISFYIGMMHGFYTGDYTKSYIGCAWGTHHIGLVSVCYGAMCALTSLLSGWLVKRLGRLPILIFAAIINFADILLLLLWKPDPNEPALFFIASGMFGFVTGIFWSQVRAFYGVLFKEDEEAAFATYHLWQSLGTCLSFAYSNYLCTSVKVYCLMAVSTVAIVGYLMVELPRILKRQ